MDSKRAFDIAFASAGTLIGFPFVVLACLTMAVANRSSPLFEQERVGLNRTTFTIYKIKSMKDTVDENGILLPDDQRTTFLGKLLRKFRIDELPQFLNIFKGDMSVVGPRPVHKGHTSLARDIKRHNIKPGLTGPAQIAPKKDLITDQEVLALDHAYVDTHSLSKDFMICVRTPISLITNYKAPHFNKNAQVSLIPK